MAEDWIVRVEGKDYGPVDLATLLEWRAEGRLIRDNKVRPPGDETWVNAGTRPELFPVAMPAGHETLRRGTFGQFLSKTFRVYRRGFGQFFCVMLLVSLPSFLFQVGLLLVDSSGAKTASPTALLGAALLLVAAAWLIAAWPVCIAGLQLVAADCAHGKASRLGDVLRRATRLWPRMARLCLFVYTTYFFWTIVPLFAVVLVTGREPSAGSLLWAIAILLLMGYMIGRLFINFLFWQPAGALSDLDAGLALQESRQLARSRPTHRRLDWPLYRGIIVATIWLIVLVGIGAVIELPFVFMRLHGLTSFDDPMAVMRQLTAPQAPDAITIASYGLTALVHAVLRPLLAAAFVVLYLETKGDSDRPRDGS